MKHYNKKKRLRDTDNLVPSFNRHYHYGVDVAFVYLIKKNTSSKSEVIKMPNERIYNKK